MNAQKILTPRAWAELILLALIWGGSFLSIRIALDEIGFLTSVAHRVFWATLVLWLVVWLRGIALPRGAGPWLAFLVMGLLNNVLPFSLMAWGQLYVASGLTSIFNAATAIFGVLLATLFFADERLTGRRLTGVLLGFLGVVTAIGIEALWSFDPASLAQIAILGGALSYAAASVWARRMLGGLAPELAAAGMLSGSCLIILPATLLIEGVPSLTLAPATWGAIAYFSVLGTALAYLLYYRVLAMAGSGNLMLCTLLIPPVAIVLGVWFRDETLPGAAYLGFLLLAAGLIVIDGRAVRTIRRRISV